MKHLLYLVHRIPFPPNKGDKIRSYHILRHLARQYRVHLGAFVDDAQDWQYLESVKGLCASTCILSLSPARARLKSLSGLLTGDALSLPYYRNTRLQGWVDSTVAAHGIRRALAFSSPMAQYLDRHAVMRRIVDFVDVDSDKWRQYAESKPWPMNAVYRREARLLQQAERRIARDFDGATFVSQSEAALFRQMAPESSARIHHFDNGVDSEYFAPDPACRSPYPAGVRPLVFTGAMDYWANADAVDWFAHNVFPTVRQEAPSADFYIVGARPGPKVQALGQLPGITVTGAVPDIRPYLAHAALAVAPLRIARGIQNKVLEAMSMGKTVIASPEAAEGIDAHIGYELLVARDAPGFAAQILALLAAPDASGIGSAARARVVQRYSWNSTLQRLDALLEAKNKPVRLAAVSQSRSRAA